MPFATNRLLSTCWRITDRLWLISSSVNAARRLSLRTLPSGPLRPLGSGRAQYATAVDRQHGPGDPLGLAVD